MPAEAGERALPADPRFRYAFRRAPSGRAEAPLIVAVHGSDRPWREMGAAFVPLADARDCAVLAPLFPVGAVTPGQGDGYKFLREGAVDYVALLDAMLADFGPHGPVHLFGFSGGAQFVLRYALVRASRLAALVVAAPGSVTLLDDALPWWAGTAGIVEATGYPRDPGLAALPVHCIVGAADGEAIVDRGPGDPYHSPHAALAGGDRRARLHAMAQNWRAAGIAVSEETLPGVGHDRAPIAAAAARWLAGCPAVAA